MDRKGLIGVVVCLVLYVVLSIVFAKMFPPVHHPAVVAGATPAASTSPTLSAAPSTTPVTPAPAGSTETPIPPATAASATPAEPEKLNFLENEFIKVTLTTQGASIKQVDLNKHREGDGDVILNDQSRSNIMALTGWPGADSTAFQVQTTPTTATYTAALPNGVTWTRTYTLGKEYTITVQDTLANAGATETVLPAYTVSLGRAKPLLVKGKYQPISNQYIGAGWLTTEQYHLTTVSDFNPTGMFVQQPARDLFTNLTPDNKLHIFSRQDFSQLRWVAVQDQFFAVLLTPDEHHPLEQATFQCFNKRGDGGHIPQTDEPNIEASADFPEIHLPAGQSTAVNYTLYTGPREYSRLNALGDDQGELMNYDGFLPFSWLIVPMLGTLHFFNDHFHSYGVAIILLTLVIKAITWPLQSFANRSGKRMQALAPKIKELQAKYKDQPEKVSSETFALYRDYGVNPFGGCLPAFIQMPVFFSLYYMLQNAVELRGQHFLWVKDLTQPDTIFTTPLPFSLLTISHITINPLPIIVTALMAVMMRMTPQIGDPQQQKVAQFMPLFFLFLFYNFAAALSLYYVFNNSVAIIQIYRNLKKPLPDLVKKPKPAGK
jgi:YidC/Oxa1 family membrane protein insertase